MSTLRILVIGGNGAGLSAASQARRVNPNVDVTVFEAGSFISFGACGLPYFISGEVPDLKNLFLFTPEKMKAQRGIDVKTRQRVVEIEPAATRIHVEDEETGFPSRHEYDRLIIATGSSYATGPFTPGKPLGVLGAWNAGDAIVLKTFIESRNPQKVVVAGGNLLGLEMAEAFHKRGMKVTVVEMQEHILPNFGMELSKIVLDRMENMGISVIQGTPVSSVTSDENGFIASVILGDGTELPVDMLFLGIGAKPNSEIALKAGCAEGVDKTIVVNRRMQTSISHIYACGDCAQYINRIDSRGMYFPMGSAANRGGRVAGENSAGGNADFPGVVGTIVIPIFGLEIGRTGLNEQQAAKFAKNLGISESQTYTKAGYLPDTAKVNIRLLYDRDNRKLLGAEIAGGPGSGSRINVFATALCAGMTIDEIYGLDLIYTPKISPLWDPVLFSTGLARYTEDYYA